MDAQPIEDDLVMRWMVFLMQLQALYLFPIGSERFSADAEHQ
jgi:hypothetical protein